MKRRKRWVVGGALLLAAALALPAVVSATPDGSAVVQFGNADVGSPFPVPPGTHDASPNAKFNLVPATVAISEGGSVTYEIGGPPIHQVAVYEPGTTPDDIAVPPSGTFVNDTNGRVALGPVPAAVSGQWETPAGTFSEPGRYLVLCNVRPHFAFFGMYGWVIVK